MRFSALEINGIRNLSHIRMEPCDGINILVGPNGGGKTSFLEAIGILSRSRSFRTHRIRQVVQDGSEGFLIVARMIDPEPVTVGVEKNSTGMRFHYDGAPVRTSSEQSRKVPVLLISPADHSLISGSPKNRRRWMDQGVFHVKPSYLEDWKQYNLALRNRNSLLRRFDSSDMELSVWEEKMEESALAVTESRQQFIKLLGDKLIKVSMHLNREEEVDLELMQGWDNDKSYADFLRKMRDRDRRQGYTIQGPHCADIFFSMKGRPVGEFFSRGQQKRLFLSLAIALSLCLTEEGQGKPIIMVDDLPAELDKCNLEKFLALLSGSGNQVFITCTEPGSLREALPSAGEKAWFHVKQGIISHVLNDEISEL